MYHGSHEQITEIRDDGVFGGLFASVDADSAASHGAHVHRIESPHHLTDFELNYVIEGAWDFAVEVAGGDEDKAEAIMNADCPIHDDIASEDAGEYGWELQRLRGVLAARLGYTSVDMRDEHGTTTLCLPGCAIRGE